MSWELAHPWALATLVVPILLAAWLAWRRRRARPALRIPALSILGVDRPSLRARTRPLATALRLLALALIAVALARPRGGEVLETTSTEGIDIMLVLDISGSMLAEDMTSSSGERANRIDAAKEVLADFIKRRSSDRIGLIAFDDVAVPRCPPTVDYGVLLDLLAHVRVDDEGGRTAIGSALASAINRLKESKAKSRIAILVTDGRSNSGRIAPPDAAEMARLMGVKVYTIGVGTEGLADYPVRSPFGFGGYQKVPSDIDEETLRMIAETTGGNYFRATDRADLEEIFDHVDRLERTEIDVQRHVRYAELFPHFARAAAVVVLLALVGAGTLWRTFP